MSSTLTPPHVSIQYGGSEQNDMSVYVNAGVSEDISMVLYMRDPDDTHLAILFGQERFTLEFFDVESLERLRDLAEDGARRLRAVLGSPTEDS